MRIRIYVCTSDLHAETAFPTNLRHGTVERISAAGSRGRSLSRALFPSLCSGLSSCEERRRSLLVACLLGAGSPLFSRPARSCYSPFISLLGLPFSSERHTSAGLPAPNVLLLIYFW